MPSLEEQLNEIFPNVLSSDPEHRMNGTELYGKVKDKLDADYAEGSVRVTFTNMSRNPTSNIAKVPSGHGYYLRVPDQLPEDDEVTSEDGIEKQPRGREGQKEEKFRSIFIRHAQQENQFPKHIEHTRATQREAGVNRWKFPDVVLVQWEVASVFEDGYRIDPNLLKIKSSLGEQPFFLESVELKVDLSLSGFRESFFQCVSNSKWAHNASLSVANRITDKTLSDELGRLGASYEVSVKSYGLTDEFLDSLPGATKIMGMSDKEFDEQIRNEIEIRVISSGKSRPTLDWEHIRDLRDLSAEFQNLFEWIAYCLDKTKAFTFEQYQKLREIEANPG